MASTPKQIGSERLGRLGGTVKGTEDKMGWPEEEEIVGPHEPSWRGSLPRSTGSRA